MKNTFFGSKQWTKIKQNIVFYTVAVLGMLLSILPIKLFVMPTMVIGDSMNPTLSDHSLVTSIRLKYNPFAKIDRNDIVIVQNDEIENFIVKRVIAVPGDTLEIKDNRVYVNGQRIEENYLAEPMVTQDIPAFTLENSYFVMGDNRNNSGDSRYYGCFFQDDIYSVVVIPNTLISLALLVGYVYWTSGLVCTLGEKAVDRWVPESAEPDCTEDQLMQPA